jgi:hypothetical protein
MQEKIKITANLVTSTSISGGRGGKALPLKAVPLIDVRL